MPNGLRWFWISSIFVLLQMLLPLRAWTQTAGIMKYEAAPDSTQIRADYIEYDKEQNAYTAEGNVEIWQENRKLTADRVIVRAAHHEAEALGNVIMVQGDDVLRSERMIIDLDTSLGIVFKGTLFLKKQNFYLQGEEIERVGENRYRLVEGSFTTCNGERPAWRFTGREALVTLEEYATVNGATFQVKNIPLIYSPYLVLPIKTQRQSGFLTPLVGYSNLNGWMFNNAYFWAIAKNMDATLYLDLASKKGIGEGVEYRLASSKNSSTYAYAYHVREGETYRAQRTDPLDRKPDRWLGELIHQETFGKNFFGKARLWGFSDREYFKDYGRTYEERALEQAYSFVCLTKNWEKFSLSGEARQTTDLRFEDKTTLQNYPLINFSEVNQRILKTPFYQGFTSSYGYFYREEGVTGHLLDFYPRFTMPLKWKSFEFSPELRLHETYYNVNDGGGRPHPDPGDVGISRDHGHGILPDL